MCIRDRLEADLARILAVHESTGTPIRIGQRYNVHQVPFSELGLPIVNAGGTGDLNVFVLHSNDPRGSLPVMQQLFSEDATDDEDTHSGAADLQLLRFRVYRGACWAEIKEEMRERAEDIGISLASGYESVKLTPSWPPSHPRPEATLVALGMRDGAILINMDSKPL
eukprot:TRINITY_DN3403_c0_g1_i1.p1 TRINITY_DN3403_c0_g1~~TRINITY_DN3403_c0_g1_i1.p1  ORF type:complete len:167 (+),score=31.59 TRINITY_DN3403_c0_g1_i1:108-608(+)